jgi:hypothetical protein
VSGRNPLCREVVNTPLSSVQSQNRPGLAHMIEPSDVYLASTTKPARGESAERAEQSESALTSPNRDPLLFFNGECSGLRQPR